MSGQIFNISHSFSENSKKLIFRPGNHEINNSVKFWRDGKKRIRTQRPKIVWKQEVLFQDEKFVDLCNISNSLFYYR